MTPFCYGMLAVDILDTEDQDAQQQPTKIKKTSAYAMAKLLMARRQIEADPIISFLSSYSITNLDNSNNDVDVYSCLLGFDKSVTIVHLRQSDDAMPTNKELYKVMQTKRVCNLLYLRKVEKSELHARVMVLSDFTTLGNNDFVNAGHKLLHSLRLYKESFLAKV